MHQLKFSVSRVFMALCFFSSSVFAVPQNYVLDPFHTAVTWHVSHFGFSNPSGKWYANGTMVFDDANPTTSSVNVNISIAKLVTGIPKLDYNLLGSAFLNAQKYPTATFVSNRIVMKSKTSGELFGNLTLHGVTNPVILTVQYNKVGIDPITNKKTVGFSATTTIDRSDFGITTYIPGISDEVKLDIEVEAAIVNDTGK